MAIVDLFLAAADARMCHVAVRTDQLDAVDAAVTHGKTGPMARYRVVRGIELHKGPARDVRVDGARCANRCEASGSMRAASSAKRDAIVVRLCATSQQHLDRVWRAAFVAISGSVSALGIGTRCCQRIDFPRDSTPPLSCPVYGRQKLASKKVVRLQRQETR